MNKQELIQKFSGEVNSAIEYVKTLYPKYPEKPVKPISKPVNVHNITSAEAFDWAEKLKVYEDQMEQYRIEKDNYDSTVNHLDHELEEFLREESGLNSVPERYRNRIWTKAWSDGHSDGYSSVYYHLRELVEIFE